MTDILFNSLPGKGGNIGEIILNRPKALNSLTLKMCQEIYNKLILWANEDMIKAVIIKGAGDKAFCAGGDIRSLYDKRKDIEESRLFFLYEYSMNATLFHFPKPFISFLDGITMGGGAGVSIHGSHRVATEKFIFAMPETLIGFYPDIGAGHFLTRCPDKSGWYLGLTGNRINAADAIDLGIINHFVDSKNLSNLQQMLLQTEFSGLDHAIVSNIIEQYTAELPKPDLKDHQPAVESCFSQLSIEGIIDALKQHQDPWCHEIADTLLKRSPTSLKVAFEQLNRASHMPFDDIIQMDFEMVQAYLHNHDFFEGIRAAVIDKDQHPKWQPNSLADVNVTDIAEYFRQKGHWLFGVKPKLGIN